LDFGASVGYTSNMCLAVPVKIISVEGDQAEVDIGGVGRKVSIALTPEARVGDYVLLHTGYALNVLDEEEAQETLSLLERMVEAGEGRE
jgi:hydrogenase expression/formation protein HypC